MAKTVKTKVKKEIHPITGNTRYNYKGFVIYDERGHGSLLTGKWINGCERESIPMEFTVTFPWGFEMNQTNTYPSVEKAQKAIDKYVKKPQKKT